MKECDCHSYQEVKFLGVFSTLEIAKEVVLYHSKNLFTSPYYDRNNYDYYIFESGIDEVVEFDEAAVVFTHGTYYK
jgi:hypothetical protein